MDDVALLLTDTASSWKGPLRIRGAIGLRLIGPVRPTVRQLLDVMERVTAFSPSDPRPLTIVASQAGTSVRLAVKSAGRTIVLVCPGLDSVDP